jgi:hypothetical protein
MDTLTNDSKPIKEYLILSINTSQYHMRTTESFARSLYYKLNNWNDIEDLSLTTKLSDSSNQNSIKIVVETPSVDRIFNIEEIYFQSFKGSISNLYLSWLFGVPQRGVDYIRNKINEIRCSTKSVQNRILRIIKTIPLESIIVLLESILNILLIPATSIILFRSFRRLNTIIMAFYLSLFVIIIILITWDHSIPFIITWISNITEELLKNINSVNINFNALFPIITGLIITIAFSILAVLGRILKWLLNIFNTPSDNELKVHKFFPYLLDPLYANEIKENLNSRINSINNNVECVFLICEDVGTLLAFEVLTNKRKFNISKDIYLLTRNPSVIGFIARPCRSFWLLINSKDWSRFSKPLIDNQFWYHFTRGPMVKKVAVNLSTQTSNKLPTLEMHTLKTNWCISSRTILINDLIELSQSYL